MLTVCSHWLCRSVTSSMLPQSLNRMLYSTVCVCVCVCGMCCLGGGTVKTKKQFSKQFSIALLLLRLNLP